MEPEEMWATAALTPVLPTCNAAVAAAALGSNKNSPLFYYHFQDTVCNSPRVRFVPSSNV